MRLSLNERLVKSLVLTLIGPGQKVTLDYFIQCARLADECSLGHGMYLLFSRSS